MPTYFFPRLFQKSEFRHVADPLVSMAVGVMMGVAVRMAVVCIVYEQTTWNRRTVSSMPGFSCYIQLSMPQQLKDINVLYMDDNRRKNSFVYI